MDKTNKNTENVYSQRQIDLLVGALENSKENNDVWLNAKGKTSPRFYPKGPVVSPFNSLILAIHSDKNDYHTNAYTLFSEAKARGESVLADEKGVPFNWYNWSKYVNKNNPNDIISRSDYRSLDPEHKEKYKGIKNRETRILFNIEQTTMPMSDEDRFKKDLLYHGTANDRGNLLSEERHLHRYVNQLVSLCNRNLVPIRRDGSGIAHYDSKKDVVYLPAQKTFNDYHDYVHELIRQIVTATGHQQRLARDGMLMNGAVQPSSDAQKQERLITELSTGVLAMELGIPAKLSFDSKPMVDYWIRELRENPKLLDIIESDVNNAVELIHQANKNLAVEKNEKLHRSEIEQLENKLPKHYYIADEIKDLPNKDTKDFVLVKDAENRTAEVILPAGASTTVNNEIPGMNKSRIEKALYKSGLEKVVFYNSDGAFGYRPDDSYFKGKEVSVARMNNWALSVHTRLDVSDAVNRANNIDFKKVLMLQDDAGKWLLYVKPENEDAFCIHPERTEINEFFTTRNQGVELAFDQLKQDLAMKYYMLTRSQPGLKVDLFKSPDAEIDMSKIERVNIFKTKQSENGKPCKILCLPTIQGVPKLEPREMSNSQWYRLWLAPDMSEYKKHIAAQLFADVLKKGNERSESQEQEDPAPEKKRENTETIREKEQGKSTIMEEYEKMKKRHPDAILLFRIGDFYETILKDAAVVSNTLGITLTQNNRIKDEEGKPITMAGFPYHALDTYLPKLIRAGHRVAICAVPSGNLQAIANTSSTDDKSLDNEESPRRSMHF